MIRSHLKSAVMLLLLVIPVLLSGPLPLHAEPFQLENDWTVVDQSGRRLQVKKPFQRIISLYGAHTENLFALGLNREIIGVSRNEVFPPEAKAKPVFSYHDDPEKFMAARPDLVLVRPMIDRAYPQLMMRLEKSGIAVCSLQPATVDEIYTYWKILGILTGSREKAAEMIARFQTAIAEFKSLRPSINHPKRVYFEAIHSRMKTFTPESMAIFALETAGGINVAADATASRGTNIGIYGKERILTHAKEIDVFLAQVGVMNRPTLAMIKNEPGFATIKAVKTNQIYFIDEMIVSRPSFRLLNGIYEIGRILYPDVYAEKAETILQKAHR